MPDFGFDDWIDAQLRHVPVPPDLLSRLAEIGSSSGQAAVDEQIDAVLRNVPLPADLESRLYQIARPVVFWRRVSIIRIAASLLIAIGLGYASYLTLAPRGGGSVSSTLASSTGAAQSDPVAAPLTTSPATISLEPTPTVTAPPVESVVANEPPAENLAENQIQDGGQTQDGEPAKLPFTLDHLATAGASIQQALEAKQHEQAALGAGGTFEPLPELDLFEASEPLGISPPRVRGYDWMFQLKYGEHPFIAPSANEALFFSRMPFTFRTASFDRAIVSARDGRLPSAAEIRVEDFLAAQDYLFPPAPKEGLALHAAACSSPHRKPGLYLLQLAVQAAEQQGLSHPATRLIAVVDASSAMKNGGRWETIRRALSQFTQDMTGADRLTLITFAETSRVVLEDATRDDLLKVLATGILPQPAGSANLAAAIGSACEKARALGSTESPRVVFMTSGREELEGLVLEKSHDSLKQLAAAKIPWQIIQLTHGEVSLPLVDWARQTQGQILAANSASEVRTVMFRALTGPSALVAVGATLKLNFNPSIVTGYRLLGHEASSLTSPASDPLEIDLCAHQSVTGMYEIEIKPSGGDELAFAELTWTDPASGKPRRLEHIIRRSEIAKSFSQAPAWLQQGVIASRTAEVLRGSRYVSTTRPWAQIQELAEQVDSRAAQLPDFRALLGLVKQVEKLR